MRNKQEESAWPRNQEDRMVEGPRDEAAGLLHELQRHRLDLEKQCERLKQELSGLRKTEADLNLILDTVPAGIVIVDRDGQIVFSNSTAERLLAETGAGLVGKRLPSIFDSETMDEQIALREGKNRTFEVRTVSISWKASPCCLAVIQDVTERKRAERAVRSLSQRLLQVQEKERRELGQALHDEVGGTLTVLKLSLGRLRSLGDQAEAALKEIDPIVDDLVDEIRYISHSMRPAMLDDHGLVKGLSWYFDRYQRRTGIRLEFSHNLPDHRLPAGIETTVFHIAREAITNAARHSGTMEIHIDLSRRGDMLEMQIRDLGCGFDPQQTAAGLGLSGMEDLADLAGGSLSISSSPGAGTSIRCRLPLRPRPE